MNYRGGIFSCNNIEENVVGIKNKDYAVAVLPNHLNPTDMKTRRASIEIKFQLLLAAVLIATSFALMSFSVGPNTHHENSVIENDDTPLRNPSKIPEFCTGENGMFEFLSDELKYPEIPRVNGDSGLVQVQFVVTKEGKVRDAKVLRPVNPWLDAEALRVAKLLDCFEPAMDKGKAVDAYFVLPIRFSLAR